VNSPNLSIQAKTAQTLSHGEEVMSIIQAQGVSAENIQYAKEFISDVRLLTAQLKPEKNGIVAKYIDDVAAYEHGVSTSMLAGILSHVVEIRMDKPVQIVGLAGLFHDVGLAGLPKEVRNENDTTLSPENKALYRTHPALGAKALRDAGTMDPGVLQAIEQHHMRHLGQGFPEKTGTSPLGKVGEIIGLCEEFNRMLLRGKADPTLHVLRTMEATVFPGFSRQIVYAFRSAFFPKIN
jgi:HD-GYP domain-containing protein (c-di-GMP phosphodiesterase class II)